MNEESERLESQKKKNAEVRIKFIPTPFFSTHPSGRCFPVVLGPSRVCVCQQTALITMVGYMFDGLLMMMVHARQVVVAVVGAVAAAEIMTAAFINDVPVSLCLMYCGSLWFVPAYPFGNNVFQVSIPGV